MYKLYYDTLAGDRINRDYLNSSLDLQKKCWTRSSSIHYFLSLLGINYCWTNNKDDQDAVVVIELDSADENSVLSVIKFASENYKKSIVLSSTEPATNLNVDTISKIYKNVLYICVGDHTLNDNLTSIQLFPFFLLRPISLLTKVNTYHLEMCNFLTSKKRYLFNHLSNYWAPNKYHMHYTIKNYFTETSSNRALVSYKPINYSNKSQERLKSNMNIFNQMKLWIEEINKREIFSRLYPVNDYIDKADPNSDNHYKLEKLPNDGHFHYNELFHPVTIYKDSHISLVSEVIKGRILGDKSNISYSYISEKTIQPLIHGHLFLVNSPDKFHTEYLQDKLGFQLYNEIFDYELIEKTFVPKCENSSEYLTAYNIITQMNNFNTDSIIHNANILSEKIQFNRDLIINPYSKLRVELRNSFVDILEKYRNLNV